MDNAQLHTKVNCLPTSEGAPAPVTLGRVDYEEYERINNSGNVKVYVNNRLALNQRDQNVSVVDRKRFATKYYPYIYKTRDMYYAGVYSFTKPENHVYYDVDARSPSSFSVRSYCIGDSNGFLPVILLTDMLCNVHTKFIVLDGLFTKQIDRYLESREINLEDPDNYHYQYDISMNTLVSRHEQMTAPAGAFVIAAWFGTEWRPIYKEDSPSLEHGVFSNYLSYEYGKPLWKKPLSIEPWS